MKTRLINNINKSDAYVGWRTDVIARFHYADFHAEGWLSLTSKPSALIYGWEPVLLETRKLIFQHAGYRVSAVADLTAAEAILATDGPDLYVLCHTLPEEQRERALKGAHEKRPHMRNLILSRGDLEATLGDTDYVFYALQGPRAMIAAANRILASSDLAFLDPHP